MKITPSKKEILSYLVFPETFQNLMEESGMHYGTLRDDLMDLVNYGYVAVYEPDTDTPTPFYDIDNLDRFSFRATKTGLNEL